MGDKSVNVAALILLAFGLLWLMIALCGAAGVPLTSGATVTSFVQGLCALLAVLVIVSRLRVAPLLVGGLSLVIFLAPLFGGGGTSAQATDPDLKKHIAMLALPQPLRDKEGEQFAFACHSQGYQDPPVLQEDLKRRQQALGEWVRAHPSEVNTILRAHQMDMPPPAPQVEERAVRGLAKDSFGEEWRWLPNFLKDARAAGLDDGLRPLSSGDQKKAEDHAAAWLAQHPNPTAMVAYENPNAGPDPEQQFGRAKRGAISLTALWILLPAWYFLWRGMSHLRRPWDPVQLPGWVAGGLRGLLRPTPGALLRVVVGMAVLLGGVVLMAVMLAAGLRGARLVQVLALTLGGGLLVSGLNVNEESVSI